MDELYEKLCAEQDRWRGWLLSLPKSELLHHAFEYTSREDIIIALNETALSDGEVQALLRSPSPLAELYEEFRDRESDHMDEIRDAIKSYVKRLDRERG